MIRRILFLTGYDLGFMLRSRETLMWLFLMPGLFMFVIGSTFSSRKEGEVEKEQIALVSSNPGAVTRELIRHLEALEYEVIQASDSSQTAAIPRRLVLPDAFDQNVVAGVKQEIVFQRDNGEDLGGRLDQVRLNRAIFMTLGDLALLSGSQAEATDSAFAALAARPSAIELEVQSAGRRRVIPSGFQQAVPGVMVMFLLLVLLTSGGVLLVIEREAGLLRRLASSPASRGEIIVSRISSRLGLGLVQVSFAMLIGTLFFRVNWGGQVATILGLLFVYAFAMAALSVLFGNLARNPGQAIGFGVLTANVFAALGGCWWPIEVVPRFMQKIAWLLPTGWTMHALHRLMSSGDPASIVLGPLALLALSGVLFLLLAVRTFRYQ